MSLPRPIHEPDVALRVLVEPALRPCMPAAATRLGYANPTLRFSVESDGLGVMGSVADETVLRREVLHAVYREHVLERTLPLRRSLLDGLMRP